MLRSMRSTVPWLFVLQLLFASNWPAVGGQKDRSKQLNDGIGKLSVNILKKLAVDGKNSVHSAYGIASALALCLFGAEGETYTALQDVLGLSPVINSDIPKAFRDADRMISSAGSADSDANNTLTMSSANALFANKSLDFKPAYLKTVRKVFNDAAIETIDFASDANVIQLGINAFVRNKTHGKIQYLLEQPLEPDTVLAIINAVYFKGSWKTALKNKSSEESFNNFTCGQARGEAAAAPTTTAQKVNWMSLSSKLQYARSSDIRAHLLELPYQSANGTAVSMLLVLPFEAFKCNFTEWVKHELDWDRLNDALQEMFETRVELTLPKFKLKSTYDVKSALSDLGLEIAFSSRASFGGMLTEQQVSVPIDNFLHKAKMSVDELGTEAAAATGAFLRRRSRPLPSAPPIELVFDRSFVSMIVVSQEGSRLPLFTALVNEV